MCHIILFARTRQGWGGEEYRRCESIRLIEARRDGGELMFWFSTLHIGGPITKQNLGWFLFQFFICKVLLGAFSYSF